MKEIYKDIIGYEGLYQVSNLGNVKSLIKEFKMPRGGIRISNEKLLSQHDNGRGYLIVKLCNSGLGKNKRVHVLVANSFIENNLNRKEINHKDGNKLNNNVSNLEWCTRSENVIHSYKNKKCQLQ